MAPRNKRVKDMTQINVGGVNLELYFGADLIGCYSQNLQAVRAMRRPRVLLHFNELLVQDEIADGNPR